MLLDATSAACDRAGTYGEQADERTDQGGHEQRGQEITTRTAPEKPPSLAGVVGDAVPANQATKASPTLASEPRATRWPSSLLGQFTPKSDPADDPVQVARAEAGRPGNDHAYGAMASPTGIASSL